MASAHDLLVTLASKDRLAFLATFNARIWEVVGGGPQGLKAGKRLAKKLDAQRGLSAVNPQPLPPDGIAMARTVMLKSPGSRKEAASGDAVGLVDIDLAEQPSQVTALRQARVRRPGSPPRRFRTDRSGSGSARLPRCPRGEWIGATCHGECRSGQAQG